MSTKIEERVVGMRFNGDQFRRGIADVTALLGKLKSALNLGNAGKGLDDLNNSARNFSLGNMATGIQDIASKFSAMSIVGITALATIASKAVDAGLTIAKSLTLDPIKAGFAEYELKMGSIQTILANTARYGTQLPEVTSTLDELNTYADKTIYSFGDMTKNIGLFTNAGIKVGDAAQMIKGFSNEAAASGTNAQGAAGAAYQLSQALSAGTIRLMDWRSLQNVGMGNKNMQNGLIEIADAMGTLEANTTNAEEVQKDFNGSLEKNWLSADVMSTYLKIMASDNKDLAYEQAKAIGLTDDQARALANQAEMGMDAATKVRTFTQLVGTIQESVGSGWAQTIDMLVGDFNEATDLFTAINDELGGIIGAQSDWRNKIIGEFVNLGGRETIIEGVKAIYGAVKSFLTPIGEAFKEIFPPITGVNIKMAANEFLRFAKSLQPSEETLGLLKRTFKGVFAVLDIGRMVLGEIIGLFKRVFGAATEGAGGILEITANIGDFLVNARDAIKNGDGLQKFFEGVGNGVQWLIDRLRDLGKWTTSLVTVEGLRAAWEGVGKAFQWIAQQVEPVGKFLGEAFQNVKDAVKGFFETMDFNVLVGLLNVGALGTIAFFIKKFVDTIKNMFNKGEGGDGLLDKIKDVFGGMTDTFDEMQNTLKSGTLLAIAIAIGLLVASVVALSFIDTGKLFTSLGAMGVMFALLAGAMVILDKFATSAGFLKMGAISGALIALGFALLILSAAMKIMSTIEWDEMLRGMAGLAFGITLLVGASKFLSKMSGRLIFAAPAIIIIAGALLILSAAMKIFSTMSWDDMLRAGTMLAAVLGIMVGAMSLVHSKVFAAASMVLIAVAINILAGAMKIFSTMSWDDIGRAATMFAATMAIMAGGMAIMGSLGVNGLLGAAAMVVAAAAITILSGAMLIFAQLSWDEIGRALVVMAGGLAILAGAMALMGIPIVALGGLALFVVSAGLTMLAPALKTLGSMSWDDIGRGLTMLGASLAILAVGGLLLIPASVGFLLLGAAILMIGTGAFLAGVGIAAFAGGIALLASVLIANAEPIKGVIISFIELIPQMMAAFAQGLIDFALVIANGATEFTAAMTTLIQAMIMGLMNNAPLLINTMTMIAMDLLNAARVLIPNIIALGTEVIISFLQAMIVLLPAIVDTGMTIVIGIINGISNRIGEVITAGTNLIINFIQGIGNAAGQIAQAGADTIIRFVNSLASTIESRSGEMRAAGGRLATAILDGMTGGLFSGASRVIGAAADMAGRALSAAKNALGIASPSKEFTKVGAWSSEGMANGITKNASMVDAASEEVAKGAIATMQKSLRGMKEAVATDMQLTPTIKPILDLSSIKKDSNLIGGMLNPPTFNVDESYKYAAPIAENERSAEELRNASDKPLYSTMPAYADINFNQTIIAPKEPSRADLYRSTKNLISIGKDEINAANRKG